MSTKNNKKANIIQQLTILNKGVVNLNGEQIHSNDFNIIN